MARALTSDMEGTYGKEEVPLQQPHCPREVHHSQIVVNRLQQCGRIGKCKISMAYIKIYATTCGALSGRASP
jgi:hypothetical protein